jgi:hypothetical protein
MYIESVKGDTDIDGGVKVLPDFIMVFYAFSCQQSSLSMLPSPKGGKRGCPPAADRDCLSSLQLPCAASTNRII